MKLSEWLTSVMSVLKPGSKIFRLPGRGFRIPETTLLEKAYLILTSMHFEIVEQKLESQRFHLVSVREQSQFDPFKNTRPFRSFWILIEGMRNPDATWNVRITFKTDEFLSQGKTKYADLLLDDITQALNWQNYVISESQPDFETQTQIAS